MKVQVTKSRKERSEQRGRDLSARDSIHSRTPDNVSHTVLYD